MCIKVIEMTSKSLFISFLSCNSQPPFFYGSLLAFMVDTIVESHRELY